VADPRNTPTQPNAKPLIAREWQPEISNGTDAKKAQTPQLYSAVFGLFLWGMAW
jgi:hypothetical protein